MNIALVSLHDALYQPLGAITWDQNKVPYAELHGYAYCCKTEGFEHFPLGFEKIYLLRDLMSSYPYLDWLWWTGCDAMITNFTIKVEDRIDNNYHLIIATDCNGINSDSIFVRNSAEGRAYLDYIISVLPKYRTHVWYEQQALIDSLEIEEYKKIIKIVPQKLINAYDYRLYPECQPVDKSGENGQWEPGDLLIHWPGKSLSHRIHMAQYYSTVVVK
jgi:hypothetical protein